MQRNMDRVAKWVTHHLISWRLGLLSVAALAAAVAIPVSRHIEFDRSVENMLSDDDPILAPYRQLKRTFGGNEIALAVYQDRALLAPDGSGIRRLATIRQRLQQIPGVRAVLSLDRLMGELIIDPDNALAERTRKLFEGYTHGADGKTAVAVCMLSAESDERVSRRETIAGLRDVMQRLPDGLSAGMVTGEPVMLVDGYRFVEQDGIRLGRWSTVLLGITIFVCFRSFRWVLIAVAVVQLALLMTRSSLAVAGLRLSMVSSMLTAVVTVVGVATVVHVIVRFREAQLAGHGRLAALVRSGRLLSVPIFWACVTDAVGFAALVSARVGPVQDFGVMMALGCLGVLIAVALLVPGMAFCGPPGARPRALPGEAHARAWLGGFSSWITRRPRAVAGASLLLVAFALWGVVHLEVETDFTRNFHRGSEIVRAYDFVEQHLGGAGVCDIIIPVPSRLDWKSLARVRQLETELDPQVNQDGPLQGLTKVLSLADAVVVGAPSVERIKIPLLRESVVKGGLVALRGRMPEFYDALFAEDPQGDGQHYLRVMLRARERQPAEEKRAMIEELTRVSRQHFPKADVTGFFVLLTNLVDSILRDQWRTFGVAIAGIGLTMLIAFRSLPLALAALVPNALPILIVSGMMGWIGWLDWFDLRINMGAAMIAAVSMGLSIDSSIHYIFAFRHGLARGRSVQQALESAHETVGLAMIFATIALIIGFSVLATSQFMPTVYFGYLVSLAMIGGLLGNLVILPLLLRWIHPA